MFAWNPATEHTHPRPAGSRRTRSLSTSAAVPARSAEFAPAMLPGGMSMPSTTSPSSSAELGPAPSSRPRGAHDRPPAHRHGLAAATRHRPVDRSPHTDLRGRSGSAARRVPARPSWRPRPHHQRDWPDRHAPVPTRACHLLSRPSQRKSRTRCGRPRYGLLRAARFADVSIPVANLAGTTGRLHRMSRPCRQRARQRHAAPRHRATRRTDAGPANGRYLVVLPPSLVTLRPRRLSSPPAPCRARRRARASASAASRRPGPRSAGCARG